MEEAEAGDSWRRVCALLDTIEAKIIEAKAEAAKKKVTDGGG